MKEVLYKSTRSNLEPVSASVAILKGLTEDGGLFVPDHIPSLEKSLGEMPFSNKHKTNPTRRTG